MRAEGIPEAEHDEELELALALSASEAEARQGIDPTAGQVAPPGKTASQVDNGRYVQRPPGSGSGGQAGGLGEKVNRLAQGLKRMLVTEKAERDPNTTQHRPWVDGGFVPAGAAAKGSGAMGGGGGSRCPPQGAPATSMASDEALARALQEQFDLEAREQQHGRWPQPSPGPALQHPHSHHDRQPGPPRPPMPHTPPAAATLLPPKQGCCTGCGKSLLSLTTLIGGGARYLTAMGREWHPGCFKCAACARPLAGAGGSVQFTVGSEDGLPYHTECHRQRFHPRCCVCRDFVPSEGGRIVWSKVPFWKDKFCPTHSQDGTKRCTGCTRLQPHGEQWPELGDSRVLCLDCVTTLVADTADCQPLYDEVLRFYANMGMPLPVRPPLMLVEENALNQAEQSETHGTGRSGPVFHTRGLCLTEEYTTFRTVMRGGSQGGGGGLGGLLAGFSVQPQTVQMGPSRTEVTAILVLYGLPRLLTGSILAHELMHAWLRLNGYKGLAAEVEEGMCQLMAELWLSREAQQQQQGSYEERLASFLGHQIRTDPSVVYGDGFRAALDSYQRHGLQTMLAHLQRAGRLPL